MQVSDSVKADDVFLSTGVEGWHFSKDELT